MLLLTCNKNIAVAELSTIKASCCSVIGVHEGDSCLSNNDIAAAADSLDEVRRVMFTLAMNLELDWLEAFSIDAHNRTHSHESIGVNILYEF